MDERIQILARGQSPTYAPLISQDHDHRPCSLLTSDVRDRRREKGLKSNRQKHARHDA